MTNGQNPGMQGAGAMTNGQHPSMQGAGMGTMGVGPTGPCFPWPYPWDQGVEVVELLDLLMVVDRAVVLFLEVPESGLEAPKSA